MTSAERRSSVACNEDREILLNECVGLRGTGSPHISDLSVDQHQQLLGPCALDSRLTPPSCRRRQIISFQRMAGGTHGIEHCANAYTSCLLGTKSAERLLRSSKSKLRSIHLQADMRAVRLTSLQRVATCRQHQQRPPAAVCRTHAGERWCGTASAAASHDPLRHVLIPIVAGAGAGVACGTMAYQFGPRTAVAAVAASTSGVPSPLDQNCRKPSALT